MTPKELITNQLNEYQKALHKSFESFKKGEITKELHETHKGNLEPKIFQYKQALNCLNQ
ncbi:MAG TPA: hypothetical protein VI911_00150 [Patescibacteria group bacterium]|nr:hypothetical protein [Patescibacteria group bacterium]